MFYLPSSQVPSFEEGFIRLDHMQAIEVGHLRHRRLALAEEAKEALDDWMIHFVTGRLRTESIIPLYREALLENGAP